MTDGLKKACEEAFPGKLAIITPLQTPVDFKIDVELTTISDDTFEDFESRLMVQGFFVAEVHHYPSDRPLLTATIRKMEVGSDTEQLNNHLKVELWQATDPRLVKVPDIQHFYAYIGSSPDLMRSYKKKAIISLRKGKAIDVALNACRCHAQLVGSGDVIRVENRAFIVLPNQAGQVIHDISSTFNTAFSLT